MAKTRVRPMSEIVDDCVMPGERVLSDQEAAYRRGFHQGAWTAMNATREGVPLYKIEEWINGKLHAWRLKGHLWTRGAKVKAEGPPRAPEPASKNGKGE